MLSIYYFQLFKSITSNGGLIDCPDLHEWAVRIEFYSFIRHSTSSTNELFATLICTVEYSIFTVIDLDQHQQKIMFYGDVRTTLNYSPTKDKYALENTKKPSKGTLKHTD